VGLREIGIAEFAKWRNWLRSIEQPGQRGVASLSDIAARLAARFGGRTTFRLSEIDELMTGWILDRAA
jgi:hypothetical protein